MPTLSKQQGKFLASLYKNAPNLDPQFLKGWLIAENPAGAKSTPQHGNQNWLNIGNTDSKFYSQGGAYSNPVQAGKNTARWLKGQWSMPGFGRASQGIIDFANSHGRENNIRALQKSGWASSGYPNLESIVAGAGPAGFMKYAKGLSGGNSGPEARAVQATASQLPTTVDQGPRLSELFETLSNLDDGYDNPYAPRGSMSNWDFFEELARINEGTQDSINDMTRSLQKARQKEGRVGRTNSLSLGNTFGGGGEGASAALSFARKRLQRGIHETGTNTGPVIDDWQGSFGLHGQPWCGVFVGKALQAAGVDVDRSIVGVDEAYNLAAQRGKGWAGVVGPRNVRPGDVWFMDEHMGLVDRVNRDGTIVTLEGNSSDKVSTRTMSKDGLRFARPAYKKRRR